METSNEFTNRKSSQLLAVTSANLAMFAYTPLFAIAEQIVGLWLYFLLHLIPISIALMSVARLRRNGFRPVAILVAIAILIGLNVVGFLLKTSILAGILSFGVAAIIYGIQSLRQSRIEGTEQRTAAQVGIVFGSVPLLLTGIIIFVLSNLKFTF